MICHHNPCDCGQPVSRKKAMIAREAAMNPVVHKARPEDPASDAEQHCAVCKWWVKRVPGGEGPTWVHSETGAVAAPGADPEGVTLDEGSAS